MAPPAEIIETEIKIVSRMAAGWRYVDSWNRSLLTEHAQERFPNMVAIINNLEQIRQAQAIPVEEVKKLIEPLQDQNRIEIFLQNYLVDNSEIDMILTKTPPPQGNLIVQQQLITAVREYLTWAYQQHGRNIMNPLFDKKLDTNAFTAEAARIARIFSIEDDAEPHTISEFLQNNAKPKDDLNYSIETGIKSLDDALMGGFKPKRMTIIEADTGVGKTTLGLQFAGKAALAGAYVLFMTFEMSTNDIIVRMMSQCTQIPNWEIEKEMSAVNLRPEINEVAMRLDKFIRFDYPGDVANVNVISTSIQEFAMIYGHLPQLVVVDYIQQLNLGDNKVDDVKGLHQVSKILRTYARNYNTHIIVTSQVTTGEDKVVRAYGARAIEHPADHVLVVEETQDLTIRNLKMKKNRHGPRCEVRVTWYPTITYFQETALEGQPGMYQNEIALPPAHAQPVVENENPEEEKDYYQNIHATDVPF